MKNVTQLSIMLFLALFILSINTTIAQNNYHSKDGKCEFKKMIPSLTDKQIEQITKIKKAYQKEAQEIKNQINIKQTELKALKADDNSDMKVINKKIEERGALKIELEKKGANMHREIRKLLNEEQKLAFDKKEKRASHRPHKKCPERCSKKDCSKTKKTDCKKSKKKKCCK